MHDEIGITPDRRGEMGVTRQGQPEKYWRYVYASCAILVLCAVALLWMIVSPGSFFGAAGGDSGGFEADLTEALSGRSGSLISGDFIPAALAASATQTTRRNESPW